MELVITGAAGQVGSALVAGAASRGIATRALGRDDLDVTSPHSVAELELGPSTVLINCAAHTAVDAAEIEPDAAAALNAAAPGLLAARCAATGARLVHVSTDYVFGPAPVPPRPWEPGDPTGPASVYGRTQAVRRSGRPRRRPANRRGADRVGVHGARCRPAGSG